MCDSLQIKGYSHVKDRLDPEGIFVIDQAMFTKHGSEPIDFRDPRIKSMTFIDVENLWLLAFQSRKPEATGNDLQSLSFAGQPFNYVLIEDEPWFDNTAVCQILGYSNSRMVLGRLSVKGVKRIEVLTMGGKQEKTFIDEKNLYRLIGRSDRPEAQKFMDWVYDEVLIWGVIRLHLLCQARKINISRLRFIW